MICGVSHWEKVGVVKITIFTAYLLVKHHHSASPLEKHWQTSILSHLCFQDRLRLNSHPQDYLKRYNDVDYDTFVGLMGRRRGVDIVGFCLPREDTSHGPWSGQEPNKDYTCTPASIAVLPIIPV
uniref:Uncharacterized protein n=1 Tax=Paramormyrops kingsleyae TaxID=1676925 RepID=A0A3B3S3J8_9TELE